MKNFNFKLLGFIILFIFAISCNSTTKSSDSKNEETNSTEEKQEAVKNENTGTDYSGVYKATEEAACDIVISIKKENNNYTYNLKTKSIDFNGDLTITNDKGTIYFNFKGKIDSDTDGFDAQFSEGLLTIENYGNAMNQYNIINDCDAKYIQFSL